MFQVYIIIRASDFTSKEILCFSSNDFPTIEARWQVNDCGVTVIQIWNDDMVYCGDWLTKWCACIAHGIIYVCSTIEHICLFNNMTQFHFFKLGLQ